jgi:probable F420-dependent oxidoreductase
MDVPDPDDLFAMVEAIDGSGLTSVWVSDHILWWLPMYESLTLLSAVAARTERVKIGTSVLLLAMRNPVIVAKQLATIERLSKGRLEVGVGIGGEFPAEWEAVGVDLKTRVSRTEEMVDGLRKLWSGPTTFEGRRISIDDVDLHPKPAKIPPIWIGGRSEAAARRAGRLGDGWQGIFVTPERYAERCQQMSDAASKEGRDPELLRKGLFVWTSIAETTKEARDFAEQLMGGFYNLPFDKLERYVVYGDPEEVARRYAAYQDSGCQDIAAAAISPDGITTNLVDLLDTEVRPRLT